jgi:hypothetical protein
VLVIIFTGFNKEQALSVVKCLKNSKDVRDQQMLAILTAKFNFILGIDY